MSNLRIRPHGVPQNRMRTDPVYTYQENIQSGSQGKQER